MAIDLQEITLYLRRRVGDTGKITHWSGQFIFDAIEEAVIAIVNDIPNAFTEILDLPVNADRQTVELPDDALVITRAYGVVKDDKIYKTLKWTNETDMTVSQPCWRDNADDPTHVVYTEDQQRIWLNGLTDGPIRCSVAKLPDPIIEISAAPIVNIKLSYRNLLVYHVLTSMYGLTSNGANKMQVYQQMYLQGLDRKRSTNSLNPMNLSESES